jgi:hypothetical protein
VLFSIGLLLFAGLLAGCDRPSPSSDAGPAAIADPEQLTAEVWNDGRAEVAFYRVERTRDPCGRVREQQFAAETYLVEHRFSPTDMSKVTDGTGVSPFKHALFHGLESGSYQYERN